MSKKLNNSEVVKRMLALYGDEYVFTEDYINGKTPITVLHKKCGSTYKVKPKYLLTEGKGRCKDCLKCEKPTSSKNKKIFINENNVAEIISEKTNGEYSYEGGLVKMNGRWKANIKHNKCNEISFIEFGRLYNKRKTSCPICANKRRGVRPNDYLDSIIESNYEWLESYKGDNKIKHEIKHKVCGNIYKVRPNDFQQGYRCPKCALLNKSSKYENEIYEFIKEKYQGKIMRTYRKENLEIDIYIPECNLGIEFNGSHWHCDEVKSNKNCHLEKTVFFEKLGIRIFHIYENDWINKKEILKSMISSKINTNQRVYARKTEIRDVCRKEEIEFLNNNHLQGYAISSLCKGLYVDDELISVISFIKPRINTKSDKNLKEIELLRFANKKGLNVIGGFSKLLKHSATTLTEKGFTSITTFCNRDHSNGNLYKANGFIEVGVNKPSYFYSLYEKTYNRFSLRKSVLKVKYPDLFDEKLNEF